MSRAMTCALVLALVACSSSDKDELHAVPGTAAAFDLAADLTTPAGFYRLPFPSDLRLSSDGKPIVTGFLGGDNALAAKLFPAAQERPGWPATPVAYFQFDGPVAHVAADAVYSTDKSSPLLLVAVDGPDRGKLYPAIALDLPADAYTPPNTLAVAAFPGVVLPAGRRYALVVRRAFGDAQGRPLGVPIGFVELVAGQVLLDTRGAAAVALYQPLWDTLDTLGIARAEVAAATVITVGDVVKDTRDLSEAVVAGYDVTIDGLALDPDDGATHPRFCELHGTVKLPQFQKGKPPFNEDGYFVRDGAGKLVVQRSETAPIVITIPKQPMPAAGYPLMLYIHGSGGVAAQLIDRGKIDTPGGTERKGEGPAHVIAEHGFAAAGMAMPLNPERVPGGGPYDYINVSNLGAFASTFRQGVFEQRLLIEALKKLTVDPALLAGCTGPALPNGAKAYRFDLQPLVGLGQSMGAQYLNLLAAVEPAIGALAPTGSGGLWSKFMVLSPILGGVIHVASSVFKTPEEKLTPLHPVLSLLQLGWEPGDAISSLPRLARRPFDGHPTRAIYEPMAPNDEFFPEPIYQAMAVSFGNQEAGDVVWPGLQTAMKVAGLDGVAAYPVSANRKSDAGQAYTGVAVQYKGDGIADPHTIFSQLDEVKYQYGCFFETFRKGKAIVAKPQPLGTPCPSP